MPEQDSRFKFVLLDPETCDPFMESHVDDETLALDAVVYCGQAAGVTPLVTRWLDGMHNNRPCRRRDVYACGLAFWQFEVQGQPAAGRLVAHIYDFSPPPRTDWFHSQPQPMPDD